jgi:ketosteroid isomerase-like protein
MKGTEQRLDRLEKIEAAKAAAGRYARACDAKDVTRLARDVFTPDVLLHIPDTDHSGIDDVCAFYRAAFDAEPGTRRHFLVNHIADVNAGGDVEIDSYFFFVSADSSSVIGWGSYHDVMVVDDGRARIKEKTIVLDMHTTIDTGWAMVAAAGS